MAIRDARRTSARWSLLGLAGLLALTVVGIPGPVGAPAPARAGAGDAAVSAPKGKFGVGDSVMLAAEQHLTDRGFVVDAVVGRQFSRAVRIVRAQGDRLPRNVIVHLGANGPINPRDCRAVVRVAGPQRRVFLVTTQLPETPRYNYEHSNRRVLTGCRDRFPVGRAQLIDWTAFSDERPWLMCADGMHIACGGARAYGRFIARTVRARIRADRFAAVGSRP